MWGLCPPAAQSGISRPSTGIYLHPPLGTSYDTFDSERYIMTTDNKALRDIASYRAVRVHRDPDELAAHTAAAESTTCTPPSLPTASGCPMSSCTSSDTSSPDWPTSTTPRTWPIESPEQRIEPWEPNVTALLDPAMLKWKDLVAAGHADSDAVEEGRVRGLRERYPGGAAADSQGEPSRKRR